jgi:uncharacterized protein
MFMPLFVLRNMYRADAGDGRAAARPAHLDYVQTLGDRLILAGPLLSPDGDTVIGSMLVIDQADYVAAEKFAQQDPYAQADLFQSMEISGFRKVLPA